MRRTKAQVFLDKKGQILYAKREGVVEELDLESSTITVPGYIETALRKGRSREKGNSLELQTAKIFSAWLYGHEMTHVLRRTPLSGGWGSGKLGDLTMDPAVADTLGLKPPKLYVECKFHADILGESFLSWAATGTPLTIGDWIEDTEKKAGDKTWFLVLKGNGTLPWALTAAWRMRTPTICVSGAYSMCTLDRLDYFVREDVKQDILKV